LELFVFFVIALGGVPSILVQRLSFVYFRYKFTTWFSTQLQCKAIVYPLTAGMAESD
jgi:hypothetical protein